MKVEFLKAATSGGVKFKKGSSAEVADDVAAKLIDRGYAVIWAEKVPEETEAEDGPADS